jgi:hypothetical protein
METSGPKMWDSAIFKNAQSKQSPNLVTLPLAAPSF